MKYQEPVHNADDQISSPEELPAELPTELPEELLRALKEAYPDPKGRIAANVMAQIRAESRRAEKAENRRRRQGLIMKYGGLAACMVILSGALVIASPMMSRSEESAVMERAAEGAALYAAAEEEAAETVPETLLTADMDSADMTAAYNEDVGEMEENAVLTASAPVEVQAETEAPANPMTKMFAARPAAADAAVEEAGAVPENHAFAAYCIAEGYLDETSYTIWYTSRASAEDWTVEELMDAFDLPEEAWDAFVEQRS